jgi:hypothetical protein
VTTHLDAISSDPAGHVYWAIIPQEFVECVGKEGGGFDQQSELIRVLQKGQDAGADHAGRGFVAGAEQKHAGADDLVLRESSTSFLRCEHHADQVLLWPAPPLRHESRQVLRRSLCRSIRTFDDFRSEHVVKRGGEIARPRPKRLAIFDRDAEELADYERRERICQIANDVERPAR